MPTIRELRERMGWTQQDLASQAGVTAATIHRMEKGRPVQKTTLKLVLQALRVSTGEVEAVKIVNRVKRSSGDA